MRVFVAVRRLISAPLAGKYAEFQQEVKELKAYMEEVLADQNDINGDTRLQLELINRAFAEW